MSILDLLRPSGLPVASEPEITEEVFRVTEPGVRTAFDNLLKANHDQIWSCKNGELISFELVSGQKTDGILRTAARDSSPAGDSFTVYSIFRDGVIEKKLLRLRRPGLSRLIFGRGRWVRIPFEAHEVEELLSVLNAYSLQLA